MAITRRRFALAAGATGVLSMVPASQTAAQDTATPTSGDPLAPGIGDAVLIYGDTGQAPTMDGPLFSVTVDRIVDPYMDFVPELLPSWAPLPANSRVIAARFSITNLLESAVPAPISDLAVTTPDGALATTVPIYDDAFPGFDRAALAEMETTSGWKFYAVPADLPVGGVHFYRYASSFTLLAQVTPALTPVPGEVVTIPAVDGSPAFRVRVVDYTDDFQGYVDREDPFGPRDDERVIAVTIEIENLIGDAGAGLLLGTIVPRATNGVLISTVNLRPSPESDLVEFDPLDFRQSSVLTGSTLYIVPADLVLRDLLFIDLGEATRFGVYSLGAIPT